MLKCYKCGAKLQWSKQSCAFVIDDKVWSFETEIEAIDSSYQGADVHSCSCGAVIATVLYYDTDKFPQGGYHFVPAVWCKDYEWHKLDSEAYLPEGFDTDNLGLQDYSKLNAVLE